jgi:membrane protease YdiL (CAAX protease family)
LRHGLAKNAPARAGYQRLTDNGLIVLEHEPAPRYEFLRQAGKSISMTNGFSTETVQEPERTCPGTRSSRAMALAEVLLSFVFVHVTFRATKQFTALGRFEADANLNFTPGITMILATIGLLLWRRSRLAEYGFTTARWREGLKIGLLWGLICVAGGAALRGLGVRHQPGGAPPTLLEGIIYGTACLAAIVVFGRLLRRWRVISDRIPSGWFLALLATLLLLPLMVAYRYQHPLRHALLTVAWLVIGAGCGEEVFFRGYIQPRINEAFGRPFRLFGIQFGLGLLISSLLFGFLHALNTVDYFHGRFTFAWGFGIATVFAGLLYGCLRESTGSLLASMVTHAVLDVLVQVPVWMAGP